MISHQVTIFLTWLHLLAAVLWIGGMLFLSLTLVPILKGEPVAAQRGALLRKIAKRFRMLVWVSIAVLVTTGSWLLPERVNSLHEPWDWPGALRSKLGLVAILITLTAVHDFWLGPTVGRLLREPEAARTAGEHRLILLSPWVARLSLLLAVGVLLAAVALVRT
ncbi:MAG: DUF4149 domain-containing protein [Anaerolineales bacterium]